MLEYIHTTIYIKKSLWKALKIKAAVDGKSISAILRALIVKYLKYEE